MAFNRIVEVEIGPEEGSRILINGLRIDFEVKKTITTEMNTAKISIYNLSEATRLKISPKGYLVILRIGYADENSGIPKITYTGFVTKTVDRKDGPDRIFEIEALDGDGAIKSVNSSISFSAGTTLLQAVQKVVADIGLPVGNDFSMLPGTYPGGFSEIGKARDLLTKILANSGWTWMIDNNLLYILPVKGSVGTLTQVLTKDTGLIGVPEELFDQQLEQSDNLPKRWKFKCLCFADLTTGLTIQVKSDAVTGMFRIDAINMNGSNWTDEFTAEMEVTAL